MQVKTTPANGGFHSSSAQTQSPLRQAYQRIPVKAGVSQITLLADNIQAWNSRWKLLESAQSSITTQYYTWDHDIFGKAQLGHIYQKARQGLEVTLMIDAVGDTFGQRGFKSHIGGKDYLQELVRLPNAQAKVYHPHYKKLTQAVLHPTGLQALAANHDKILEVDGQSATVGGRNTGHQYFASPLDDASAWRDCDVLLQGGRAPQDLRQAVAVEWDRAFVHDEVRPDLLGNWRKRDIELLGAYSLMDEWLKAPALNPDDKQALRTSKEARQEQAQRMVQQTLRRLPQMGLERLPSAREREALLEMAQQLAAYPELRGSARPAAPSSQAVELKVIDRTSAIGRGPDQMNSSLLGLIQGAEKSIQMQTPYYVLTEPVIEALRDAGQRGVQIQVSTNSPANTDSKHTQVFFLNDWKKSLAIIPNLTLQAATGQRKHHAKMAVFDETVALVGTYNLDLVSAAVNGEVAAVVWSHQFAGEVHNVIQQDLQDPTLGYRPYQIARNQQGQPVDLNGKEVLDSQGDLVEMPATVFGPEHHLDPKVLAEYDPRIRHWNWAREHLPQLKSTRRWAGEGAKRK